MRENTNRTDHQGESDDEKMGGGEKVYEFVAYECFEEFYGMSY
jgi:hypothetical protein